MLAPICLFVYNRLAKTKQTVEALQKNFLANKSDLFVFSDGPKNEAAKSNVNEVRSYLGTITGFKSIVIYESENNKGLANSIIDGVTLIVSKYDKVIVLEDDLITVPGFLDFMNAGLDFYTDDPNVFSISGFVFDIKKRKDYEYDVFFTKRHCSWGWAIWKDRWSEIDWSVSDYWEFKKNRALQHQFKDIGADLVKALNKQQRGETNSWAIRCNYHQSKKQTYTVYPIKSKVINIGFGDDATHTRQRFNKYKATPDLSEKVVFNFPYPVFVDPDYLRRFKRKYSFWVSVYYYILNKICGIF
ncbi:hypothetical protein A8C56_06240 [Niabella ginsenosidivorans]|uniref:Sugar transferase n=2 Tax=Niabella ginsenosidivorans TaxID=1176587 RepID=A0A1A9I7S8_9BACT|nr:hypothetical protein A8C56_06240 [Niabella ginsenosidivorans]